MKTSHKLKVEFIFLIVVCVSQVMCCADKNSIELTLIPQRGYGPFVPNLNLATIYSSSDGIENIYSTVSGFPTNWTNVEHGAFETNGYQSIYQDYFQGKISKKKYESFQKLLRWLPDTLNLSKKPIRTKIAFVCGRDSINELKLIVDTNNNLSFSDDVIFTPIRIDDLHSTNLDSLAKFNSFDVVYEHYFDRRIEKANSSLFIVLNNKGERIYYSFPQYMVAKHKGEELAVCSDFFRNFAFQYPWIVLINNEYKEEGKKVSNEELILQNGIIEIKEKFYRVLGINHTQNVLRLEKTNLNKNQLTSNQLGFKSFPIEGYDFKTKAPISLEHLKGKYVLLDFWTVYCGPCIHELPDLKAFYDKVDKSKFEIIGIVSDSPTQQLTNLLNDYSIMWPIIILDNNNILKQFGIFRYPTTFLIDKEGVIIEKDLRGKELEDKVLRLINQ